VRETTQKFFQAFSLFKKLVTLIKNITYEWLGIFWDLWGFHYIHQVHLKEVGLKKKPQKPKQHHPWYSSCQGSNKFFHPKPFAWGWCPNYPNVNPKLALILCFGINERFLNFCGYTIVLVSWKCSFFIL
jgi:hypothetical protein